MAECLKVNLEICHKSLNFDYTSVLLNETLDEPSCTNVNLLNNSGIDTKRMERLYRESRHYKCIVLHTLIEHSVRRVFKYKGKSSYVLNRDSQCETLNI